MENSQTERYTFHEVLGEGSCGRVYRCTSPDGESRAVKVLTAMAINRDLVRYSLRKLDELPDHPGIAKVYSASLSDTPYHYVIDLFADPVLDEKGNEAWKSRRLDRLIGKIDRERAWGLLDQVGEALAFLHGNDLFHGCLKPSNVFMASGEPDSEIKLSDPGQGWVSGAHYLELHDIPFYASPEQLRTAEFLDGHGKRWDVYSFGVLGFLLLNGRLPRLFELFKERRRSGASWDSANDEDLVIEPFDQPPHEYADLLDLEPAISWDFKPADESEARRIDILNRCLLLDSEERYPDMLEVVDSFRQERLAMEVEGIEELAMGWKERVKKPFQNLGRHAAVLLGLLCVAAVALFGQHLMLVHSQSQIAKNEEAARALLEEKDGEVQSAEARVAEEKSKAARAAKLEEGARSQVEGAQDFGDRMFEVVSANRGTDPVVYRKERREALQVSRDYYRKFIEKNADNEGLTEKTVAARSHLVNILREVGTRDETLGALSDYASSIEKVLAKSPDDILWQTRKAAVHREVAEIHLERNSLKEATENAAKAVAIFEKLAADGDAETAGVKGGGAEYELELAASLTLAGDVQLAAKDLKGATKSMQRSVELLLPLAETMPKDARCRNQLAENLARLGDIMFVQKDIEGSTTSYDESIGLLGELIREEPANADYQHQLAHCFVALGEIQSNRKMAQDALSVLKKLTAGNPGNEEYRHTLARCYGVLSELQRDGGQAENAMELQLAALEMLKSLAEKSPDVQEYRFDYAGGLSRLAGLEEDAGHFKEALAYLNGAVKQVEALAKMSPDSIQYQRSLAELRGNIGFANEKVGNKEKAKELYASAVYQWERLASLLPEDDLVERGLLWSRRQLAALDR